MVCASEAAAASSANPRCGVTRARARSASRVAAPVSASCGAVVGSVPWSLSASTRSAVAWTSSRASAVARASTAADDVVALKVATSSLTIAWSTRPTVAEWTSDATPAAMSRVAAPRARLPWANSRVASSGHAHTLSWANASSSGPHLALPVRKDSEATGTLAAVARRAVRSSRSRVAWATSTLVDAAPRPFLPRLPPLPDAPAAGALVTMRRASMTEPSASFVDTARVNQRRSTPSSSLASMVPRTASEPRVTCLCSSCTRSYCSSRSTRSNARTRSDGTLASDWTRASAWRSSVSTATVRSCPSAKATVMPA
mmetsp:Transcript_5607/g.18214  ORF Transcript_5607/g.18214 Transcript_5607/m.18214 type:complete len:314 (+) Transcript_5607:1863-2804(+)